MRGSSWGSDMAPGLSFERTDQPVEVAHLVQFRFFLRGEGSCEGHVKVRPEVRARVEFRQVNLCDASWPIEGPLAAMDYIEKATGERKVNFIGYCLGGTLLGATLAYLSKKNQEQRKDHHST